MTAVRNTTPQPSRHRRATRAAVAWTTLALVAALLASADATAALATGTEPPTEASAPFTLNSASISSSATSTLLQSATGNNSFTAVTAGSAHSCGLRSDGTITCWGGNYDRLLDAPTGSFTAITAGDYHSCGLRSDGTITCWGSHDGGRMDAPAGSFSAVSAGYGHSSQGFGHSCGLRRDGTITCWGNNYYRQLDTPTGSFTAISVRLQHSCGLRTDATITCWGRNRDGLLDAPTGGFTAVTAGEWHSCGLRTDATITCWGGNNSGQLDAPTGSFTAITAGWAHSCGLRTDGTITCWGNNDSGQLDAPTGSFTAITAGSTHSCGLRTDATITCWGNNRFGQSDTSTDFSAISAGEDHSCGLRTDATITCWGDNNVGQADAPSGTYSAVTAGRWHSCGLRTDATITCWGGNNSGQLDAPTGSFTAVTAGEWHSCGLRTDATITCWGQNDVGQADAPSGTYSAVTAGRWHSCGLRTDATITCWGQNGDGQADAPSGTYSAVTAGEDHSCGLRTDATITCWGQNGDGQADAPSGTYSAVTADRWHSCGLRTDATITCWGQNGDGQADAPSGTYSAVRAGGWHSCGLRTDGVVVCWGRLAMRTADPVGANAGSAGSTVDGSGGPLVVLSAGSPGPTSLGAGEGVPCAPDTPTCRYLNVDLRGFEAGTYTVECRHDGWGEFGPSTFWTFSVTVGASGSAASSGPCFLNLARLTGSGAFVTVSRNGVEVARSGWIAGTASGAVEPASWLGRVTGVAFSVRAAFFGLRLPSVSWDAVPGAASYEVEWSTADAEGQSASTVAGVACCTHQGGVRTLLANQVRVRAVNADGEGRWSDVAAAPVPPGKVASIEYRSGSAVWNAVQGAASYDVAWKYGGEKPRIVQDVDRAQLRIAQVEGKSIRITVRAVNDSGPGPWSSWKTIVASSESVPAKAVGLHYRGNSALWSPVEGATSYRLTVEYRCVIDCGDAQSQDLNTTRTFSTACVTRCSYRIFSPGVQRDAPVRFRVGAKNSAGAGPLSDWRTAEEVTPGPVTITSASPGEVTYDPGERHYPAKPYAGWPHLDWQPLGEATSYQIQVVQSGRVLRRGELTVASPRAGRPVIDTAFVLRKKADAECAPGHRHPGCTFDFFSGRPPAGYDPCRTATMRVRAVNGAGAGPWAASTISSIKPPKPYVTNLEVVGGLFSGSAKDVSVTWRDMVCTDGYDVEWRYLDQGYLVDTSIDGLAAGEARSLCFHDGGCVASDVRKRVSDFGEQYRWHGVRDVADNDFDREYRLQFRVRGNNQQGAGEWSDWASLQSYRVGNEINAAVSAGSLACASLEVAEVFAEYVLDALLLISAYFTGGWSLLAWTLLIEAAERTRAFGADKKTLVVKGIKILAGCYPSPGVALADATPVLGFVLSVTGANKLIERMYDCTEFVADNPNVWESDWNERAKAAGCEVN